MVARTGIPMPSVPRERNSAGYPLGCQSEAPVSVARARILSLSAPGLDRPERSPFTSAMTTGTPAADSCSAIPCNVLVLPVPVAPATRPWRFNVANGIRMRASESVLPSSTTVPNSSAAPDEA